MLTLFLLFVDAVVTVDSFAFSAVDTVAYVCHFCSFVF